jgi:hypothetical protein
MVLHELYECVHDSGSCSCNTTRQALVMCGRLHVPDSIERKKSLTVGQSFTAGLRTSAFHFCTWALLMQEDCLCFTGECILPVAPEDGLADVWSWSLIVVSTGNPDFKC